MLYAPRTWRRRRESASRPAERSEASDETISALKQFVTNGERHRMTQYGPDFFCKSSIDGDSMLATVCRATTIEHMPLQPLATIGVAASENSSAALWDALVEFCYNDPLLAPLVLLQFPDPAKPPAPWVATIVQFASPTEAPWIVTFAHDLAWAFIEETNSPQKRATLRRGE